MSAATPGQADPWQVITDVMSELLRGGQTGDIRCRAALRVLASAGIDFDGNPVAIATQEPHAASGVTVATFGYDGCLTPGAVYATYIGTERLSVTVDYGRELPIGEDEASVLDSALHDALESALAPYFGTAPAEAKPAPELAAAIDPAKLDLLADWFDVGDLAKGRSGRTEVQEDLRRWAKLVRDARAGLSS